jgi:LysM repeat protein
MLNLLKRGTAWRWVAAFVLVVAVALPMMPTAAFAASSDVSMAGHKGSTQCADIYWVKKGDNLSRIARWYGVTVSSLVRANNIDNPSRIYPGQRLCIPFQSHYYPGGWDNHQPDCWNDCGGNDGWHDGGHDGWHDGGHDGGHQGGSCWYVVRKGDNLSEIASWFGVSWSYLARVNHLSNPRVIVPGQVLYVCW